jgi:hypothetical protein
MKAHTHLKTHIPHIGDLTANELGVVSLWCNLQYHREYLTQTTIGSVVVKSVKDKWLEGKGEKATVKIVVSDAGLDNGLLQFGTEQLACNLTHCKEELDIHVKDQTYTILSPFKGSGDKKREMISYVVRKGKVMSSFSCVEKGDPKVWKEWRKMASGSTLRNGLSPQGPTITGGIGILIDKIFYIHLWSIVSVTYSIHSTLLSLTWNYRKKVETKLALRQ